MIIYYILYIIYYILYIYNNPNSECLFLFDFSFLPYMYVVYIQYICVGEGAASCMTDATAATDCCNSSERLAV